MMPSELTGARNVKDMAAPVEAAGRQSMLRTVALQPAPGPSTISVGPAHGHLWRLADGRGLHAPPAVLVRDLVTGAACCHFCGRWFRALGSHVRAHGLTGAQYREAIGLSKTRSLAAHDVSAAISQRQKARYLSSPEVRDSFLTGQNMARSGALSEHSVVVTKRLRPEPEAARRRALDQGRATTALRHKAESEAHLRALGFSCLADYLRAAYAAGDSLERLGRTTRLGRVQLRDALTGAGVEIRPSGVNTTEGKRSRARRADAAAAQRVHTDDLNHWLESRRASGWTLAQLAAAVGHSAPWVKCRLGRHSD
jgi:hypothetical protein